jgi:asparagine synthase (glutamine-hydrolysing)
LQEPAKTYTATFKGTAMDESSFAAQEAGRAHCKHTEFDVPMAGVPALLPRLVKAYGEPFGDYSAIPTFSLFEGLKPHVKVVLTGDGGDEVFCGYKDAQLFRWREALGVCRGASDAVKRETLESLIYSRLRKVRELGYLLMSLRRNGAEAFQSLYRDGWTLFWRSRWMRPEAWRATGADALEQADARSFHEAGRTDIERFLNRYLERLIQDFLVKVDRASMAHSIEVRCPMLDVDIFERASGLPEAVLFHKGEQKGILKELLARRMGRQFAGRTKMGFTPPLEDWFRREETCQWLERVLTDNESLAYYLFPPDKIRQLITLHRQGHNHVGRLWNLLFLNAWQRHYWGTSANPASRSETD